MRHALAYPGIVVPLAVIAVAAVVAVVAAGCVAARRLSRRTAWRRLEQACREKARREAGEPVRQVSRGAGGDAIVETSGEVLIVPGRQHDGRRTG